MLIRTEQIEELRKVPLRAFEDEMVAHLAEFSPALFNVIKEEQMRDAVRFGLARAAGEYDLRLRGPIRLYLEMMLLFGSHFDTDPQYPWAGDILRDRDTLEMDRANQLYEKTLDFIAQVSGRDAVNTRQALNELLVLARSWEKSSSENLVADILQEMTRVFPQKASYVGREGLTELIHEGIAEAQKYQFPKVRGEAFLVMMMFAFGHGCSNDPLYPWISRALEDEKIIDPAARAERLEKKAITWLEHVLASFREGAPA
ncbi:MAG TPA: hypothetical protein VN643_18525 [Pyrinomonadaceae bacterium]|nr:hypothetical protein [Pyrinomonadaceae bacterium]